MHRKVLGRGLEALIPPSDTTTAVPEVLQGGALELLVDEIVANPYQPRTHFDDEPILVRRNPGASGYQLVAGERRLRATISLGLRKIPAIVKDVADREMMELSLIENIQRENLNPIEEAKAYQTLVKELGLTHDQVSERVGKQRVSVTNSMRLLGLPDEVQEMVSRETLSAGHARALLAIEKSGDQLAAARYVQSKGFSVRRTETFVRRKLRRMHSRPRTPKVEGLREWEVRLQQKFATHVAITPGRKGGKVEFEYYGQEDLERLFEAWGVF
jgi:ParB family transcriptional regulator, chromosome partitioning protein